VTADQNGLDLPRHSHPREPIAAKVPEITALFWVIKILTTGMGESTSDFLGNVSNLLWAVVGITGFVVAMWLQLRVRRYVAPIYWFAVVMVAIVGTRAADLLHNQIGIPFWGSTALYAVLVALVFCLWHRVEGTLSIHSIVTRRRERFYWLTVLLTFALGTAAGDWTAASLRLGYLPSGIMFLIIIALPAIAWWRWRLNEIATFWFAYVLTRPLGASFADWLGKPIGGSGGGRGLGDGTVSAVATVAIVALVAYVAVAKNDIQPVAHHSRGHDLSSRLEPASSTTMAP
jgi:uncharacterized membrane-anchored protein